MTTYFARQLFDGKQIHQDVYLTVTDERISHISHAKNPDDINKTGSDFDLKHADIQLEGLVTAGFVDVQVNGGGGVLFNHQPNTDTLLRIVRGHATYGTTAMLPTLITDDESKVTRAADAVAQAIDQSMPAIVGVHFEGPHLSIAKKGIHPSAHVRAISDKDLDTYTRKDIGKVMLTLAPENVSADIIKELVANNVIVSLGHSNADIDTVVTAIEAGAQCFTHLFNAMSGLSARQPGLINAALSDPTMFSGLIVDLHHVHPNNCLLAYQCIGAKRLMLVTDAMAHVGTDLKTLPWLSSQITRHGDKLTLQDGSIAGSCLDMASAVKNMYAVLKKATPHTDESQLLIDTLNMASRTPASLLGIDEQHQLRVGNKANFVQLDSRLNAQACWINGEQIK